MKKYYLALLFIFGSSWLFAESLDSKNDNILTIDMALEKAIASNSAFLAVSKQKEISNSLLRQARQKPSPELKIGVDDYAGSGAYKKTSSMKSIIGLTQTIEMGNKRKKRISSAKASGELELVKIDIAKKELKLKVISAYFELFRLTKELEMQNEATILAKETADTATVNVPKWEDYVPEAYQNPRSDFNKGKSIAELSAGIVLTDLLITAPIGIPMMVHGTTKLKNISYSKKKVLIVAL